MSRHPNAAPTSINNAAFDPTRRRNAASTWSLVLGILAVLIVLAGPGLVAPILTLLLVTGAVVCGIVGLRRTRTAIVGGAKAKVGIALGGVAVILMPVILASLPSASDIVR